MKYYIEEVDPAEWRNVATSKARVDIFNILDSLGYEKITVGCKELSGDYSGVKRKAKELAYIMNNTKVWKQATSHLKAGDAFEDFVGPLGCPSELISKDIEQLKKMNIVFIAGGLGTAPVYPQVKWMHEHGVDVDVIVGAKNK